MKQLYTLTAGNVVTRPGHRHGCQEVRLQWTLLADSPEDAIEISHAMLAQSGTLPQLHIELGDVSAKLQVEVAS